MQIVRLYTFDLIDGRKVTYEGATEAEAFVRTQQYYGGAVLVQFGRKAERCCARSSEGYDT